MNNPNRQLEISQDRRHVDAETVWTTQIHPKHGKQVNGGIEQNQESNWPQFRVE